MNTQQLALLVDELRQISLELLDVSITTKDTEAGIKIGKTNLKLCEIGKVLCDHLEKQEIES